MAHFSRIDGLSVLSLSLACLAAMGAGSNHASAAQTAPVATQPAATAPAPESATKPAADQPSKPQGILPIPDYSGGLLQRSALTGDWGGARTKLANKGLQFNVDFTQYFQSVTSGGVNTTSKYGGHADYEMFADLMRMDLVPGGLVIFRAESRYGSSVNSQSGMILPVNTMAVFPMTQEIDAPLPITITDLNYTQFLPGNISLTLGKFNTLDADLNEFASGRGKSQFMNANFIFNPVTAMRMPYSTLGFAGSWSPIKPLTLKGAIFSTTDSSTTSGFSNIGDGTTASAEADLQYRLFNLPGGMNLGFLYAFDQSFRKIGGRYVLQPGQGFTRETADDSWSVYWSTWQYLFVKDPSDAPINLRDGRQDKEGFGLFGRMGWGDDNTNPADWSMSAGLGGRGMIPSRTNDEYGIGYFFSNLQTTNITGIAGIADQTQGVEAYYNCALTPSTNLTFDIQVQDSALPEVRNAVILGLRLNMKF
jgi:porin